MKPNTNIYIPDSVKRRIKAAAAEDGLTMNAAILAAITLYLNLGNEKS